MNIPSVRFPSLFSPSHLSFSIPKASFATPSSVIQIPESPTGNGRAVSPSIPPLPRTPPTAHPRTRITIFNPQSDDEPMHYFTRGGLREGLERVFGNSSGAMNDSMAEAKVVFIVVEDQAQRGRQRGEQQEDRAWAAQELSRKMPSCPKRLWRKDNSTDFVMLPDVIAEENPAIFFELDILEQAGCHPGGGEMQGKSKVNGHLGSYGDWRWNGYGVNKTKLRVYAMRNAHLVNSTPISPTHQHVNDPLWTYRLYNNRQGVIKHTTVIVVAATYPNITNPPPSLSDNEKAYPANTSYTATAFNLSENLRRYYRNEGRLERLRNNITWISLDLLHLSGTPKLPPLIPLNEILHPCPPYNKRTESRALLPLHYATKVGVKVRRAIKRTAVLAGNVEKLHQQLELVLGLREVIRTQQVVVDRLHSLAPQLAYTTGSAKGNMANVARHEDGGAVPINDDVGNSAAGVSSTSNSFGYPYSHSVKAGQRYSNSVGSYHCGGTAETYGGSSFHQTFNYSPHRLSGIGIAIGSPPATSSGLSRNSFGRNISHSPTNSPLNVAATSTSCQLPETQKSTLDVLSSLESYSLNLTHLSHVLNYRVTQIQNALSALDSLSSIEQKQSISTITSVMTLLLPVLVVMGLFLMVGWQGPMWVYPVIGLLVLGTVGGVVGIGRAGGV